VIADIGKSLALRDELNPIAGNQVA
jgi:hypothetical protein